MAFVDAQKGQQDPVSSDVSNDGQQEGGFGLRRWLLCCNLAGRDPGKPFAGGVLWMNWQRRGDFQKLLRALRAGLETGTPVEASAPQASYESGEGLDIGGSGGCLADGPEAPVEITAADTAGLRAEAPVVPFSWAKLNAQTLPIHLALIDAFFETPWLSFDAFVVKPAEEASQPDAQGNAKDLAKFVTPARRRALWDFAAGQIEERLRAEPNQPQPFRLWLDAKALGYGGRNEALDDAQIRVFQSVFGGMRSDDMVINHRTASTTGLQLCSLLLHAVLAAWQGGGPVGPRRQVQERIASHLGWKDLHNASRPNDTKFNIRVGRPNERHMVPVQLGLFDQPRSSRRPVQEV